MFLLVATGVSAGLKCRNHVSFLYHVTAELVYFIMKYMRQKAQVISL